MGGLELGEGGVWACKNNQVAQGRPLCSGQPNAGITGFGAKSLIANLHEAGGLQHGEGLQCGVMLWVMEGNHKARPCDWLQPSWPRGHDLSRRGRRWDMGGVSLLRGLRCLWGLGWCRGGWAVGGAAGGGAGDGVALAFILPFSFRQGVGVTARSREASAIMALAI